MRPFREVRAAPPCPRRGGRRPAHVARFELFGVLQKPMRHLDGPPHARSEPETRRPRIERADIVEIPAVLVRLAPMERRPFERPRSVLHRRGNDTLGDVGRVHRVVAQRGERILRGQLSVHERHRTERRLAHGSPHQYQRGPPRKGDPQRRGQLHREVVWVLPVGDRPTPVRFSGLKDLAVAITAHR